MFYKIKARCYAIYVSVIIIGAQSRRGMVVNLRLLQELRCSVHPVVRVPSCRRGQTIQIELNELAMYEVTLRVYLRYEQEEVPVACIQVGYVQ